MQELNNVNSPYLEDIYDQLGNLETSLQYTGFAILCKDLIEYLAARGDTQDGVAIFRGAYNTALNVDFIYLAEFHSKAYSSLSPKDFPTGLSERAAGGNMKFPELTKNKPNDETNETNNDLVKKLSPFIGWAFFREYSKALKPRILESFGEQGLPGVFEDRKTGSIELAKKLLSKAIPNEYYWYPVTLYLCILLYKTDFKSIE